MGISVTGQSVVFLSACVFGMVLGLVYDIFRIIRVAVPHGGLAVFIEDVLFFLLCAVSTFLFLLYMSAGEIRFFVIIGEILGAALYYFSIGFLVYRSAKAIIGFLKKTLRLFWRFFSAPFRVIFGFVGNAFGKAVPKAQRLVKKPIKSARRHLHVDKKLMYNHRDKKKTKKKFRGQKRGRRKGKSGHGKTP